MSTVFANLLILEATLLLLGIIGVKCWRKLGPARFYTVAALVVVVWEGLELVKHGHPTELGQVLAFVALLLIGGRLAVTREARVLIARRRPSRR